MAKKLNTELTSSEIKVLLRDIIKRNLELGKSGKPTVSIGIEGMAGTSKTSTVEQVAEEFQMNFIKLNVADKDAGDLLGFPSHEIKIIHEETGDSLWINKDIANIYLENNSRCKLSGESRMSFSVPDFIEDKQDTPCIFLLDDFSRCSPQLQNAIMDLTDRQKYSSWGLHAGSTVILTSNPDDSDEMSFNVNTLDSAQKSRYIQLKMKPSVDDWALWAEEEGINGALINFMLKHKEVIEGTGSAAKDKGIANLRTWTKFFTLVGYYKNLEDNWDKIFNLGQNSIPVEHLMLLHNFIENKLDRLPSIPQLLTMKEEDLMKSLEEVIGSGKNKRIDISSIISRRLINYSIVNHAKIDTSMVQNYNKILKSKYLTPDLILLSLKKKEMAPMLKKKGFVDLDLLKKTF